MQWITHRKLAFSFLIVGIFIASAAWAEDIWIKSENVEIRAGKGAVYPVLGSVPKGTKLTVLAHEGKWLKVQLNNQEGYVFESAVSADKIEGGGNLLANMGAGADASDMTTASAAKGLQPEADSYVVSRNLSPEALNHLIKFRSKIDPRMWEAFTAEGKVGPNAP